MPFLLLLLLSVVLVLNRWPAPLGGYVDSPSPLLLTALTWSGVAGVVAAAFAIAGRTRQQIRRYPEQRERILQRYSAWRFYHVLGLFSYYGLALFVLGWGWVVQQTCSTPPVEDGGPEGMLPGAELLTLAPFLVSLVLSWACFYDAERALHLNGPAASSPFWSRWAYLSFQLRQNLALIVAPLTLMILVRGLSGWLPDDWRGTLAAGGLVVAVFISLPWILRLVLNLKPLPEGPLRDRLLAAARRLDFRFSNILLWNTHNGVVNAMVAGLLPFPRYVLLSDRLVNELSPDEVEAVFGHEVGHVKHSHMFYYAGFLIVSMLAVAWAFNLAMDAVPVLKTLSAENEVWAMLPFVGILGAYIFVVFGFLSRRCERQADVFGCRSVSCGRPSCPEHGADTPLVPGGRGLCPTGIRTFIEALEKVARLNGISRSRPGWLQSWQHSTIARRVDFLQQLLVDPSLEPNFQRTVARVKWALLIGLGTVLLVLSLCQWWV